MELICLRGDLRRDRSSCRSLVCASVIGCGRFSSDLDRGTTLSGVVSVDCGMGGNSGTKLGCVEWSKMGSYAGEKKCCMD